MIKEIKFTTSLIWEDFLKKYTLLKNTDITEEDIKNLEYDFLSSKKGTVNHQFKKLLSVYQDGSDRKVIGLEFNKLKLKIKDHLAKLTTKATSKDVFLADGPDLTIDIENTLGYQHLLQESVQKIINFFSSLNYEILQGYEVDDVKNNFKLLNFDSAHSAQNEHDTFFLTNEVKTFDNLLLRTHCTNLTVRGLLASKPNQPVRIMSIGKVYRNDKDDPTHSSQFFQVDVVYVNKDTNLSHLKWTITQFLEYFFGKKMNPLFRVSYFPFTEPSLEVDIPCPYCQGKGCLVCKHTKYIEILGAGIIHPNVLINTNHDPNEVNGFAFGVGVERLVMIKHKIPDIRFLYKNNLRFNIQF
ncbi:phenylalanine--tRNA ligase subunit alpha [Mycoplasma sp. SG1]|uniref:phenylalanine--tRNA ligase subunit alpha n=1 Tax=Mycoplasma sp. SG1 TaxID=2810348 RepID=UPI0020254253|nr:phenylalanine--tRNA ligase subunit alpha [Mycoplasma sp. SG1]URM53190.1 phenylalanine--tRNA ligase subunit alpha [Mycoplasma sp. SG1]